MGETIACKHCGTEELDHRDDCPAGAFGRVRLTADVVRNQELEIRSLRAKLARLENAEIARASCCVENEQRAEKAEERMRLAIRTFVNTTVDGARLQLVDTIAHALVLAYRDARREGVPPSQSFFVMGILRELDALYERAAFDPPPDHS